MSFAMDLLLLATSWAHVLLAPYTKVEESFNLHATHDVLMYGVGRDNLHKFDHNIFPGAVPRTFIGSILLAWLTSPVAYVASQWGLLSTKLDLQIAVRLVLATLNATGFMLIRRAVCRRFGRPTGLMYVLLTCSQFHLPFWMGRTLPNMFALFPVNLGFYALYNRAPQSQFPTRRSADVTFALLTFTAVVFRSEVALLLAPLAIQALLLRHISFTRLISVGFLSAMLSIGAYCSLRTERSATVERLALTVTVDSYLWNQWPLWPELYGIYFNVYQGKSSDWGTSPVHAYFLSHLPKLLLGSLPLAVLGAALDNRVQALMFPPVLFIVLISCLGHKEWRFIIYVVPFFNVAAARGARWMVSRRKGGVFGRMMFLAAAGILALNCAITIVSTRASMANYPGGSALAIFNDRYADQHAVQVHISNLAAQTGASLFLQNHSPPYIPSMTGPATNDWVYNKTESLSPRDLTASTPLTHLITESSVELMRTGRWKLVDRVQGFSRWKLNLPRGGIAKVLEVPLHEWLSVLEMETNDQLYILERAK
ncbi:glycosyltransferase family 22 protein [Suillus subalutaceus]|uniref:glycosyltransferase family 22 protein n=1 Tax=Suillus subalutaceus TaxID=48586 RepID=UPI001B868EDB|nr:glycosyltransferase family 22 protein [Suillus subalutaceus]KAG1841033.1 glycosyltransferase family 22 protein [Suillus subalutaceus]